MGDPAGGLFLVELAVLLSAESTSSGGFTPPHGVMNPLVRGGVNPPLR